MRTTGNDFRKIGLGAIEQSKRTTADTDSMSLKEQRKLRYRQDTKFRRCLTIWVMFIVPAWLAAIFAVVCFCAAEIWRLSDAVMVALLATTTANILGLAYIVLKGMFPSPGGQGNASPQSVSAASWH